MKKLNEMNWEEKVAATKTVIESINNNFAAYKELIATAGHAIGFCKGQHFIDDTRWNDSDWHLFVYAIAHIVLKENLSLSR